VLLLTGPRQVGKTTLLEHLAGVERRRVSLDDPAMRAAAREDPGLLLQRFPPPLLIDEVQCAPGLLPHIKMAADRLKKPGLFWLTGSQQFHLMEGVSETLAGRVAIMSMLGLSEAEARRQGPGTRPFLPTRAELARRAASSTPLPLGTLYRHVWRGWFPALVSGRIKDRDLFYSSYVQTYLQRDVKDLASVGDEAAFLRFVRACAARTAQLLNLSELARDADININTAKRWLSILETSFQVLLLQPFHHNLTKRLTKSPKLYFLDTGLCAYLTQWSSPETLEAGAMSGAVFETFVIAEIVKSWWNQGLFPQMHFYRDGEGREVDLLLIRDRTIYPIEIKKTASPRAADVGAASALGRGPYTVADSTIVCLAREAYPIARGVNVVPAGWL
jgi:hypothetical protein